MIDSGCTNHMTGEKKMFSSIEEDKAQDDSVTIGDDKKRKVIGLEKFAISNDLSITNVLLVESLSYNLLSVSQLCEMGYNCLLANYDVTDYKRENCTTVAFKGYFKEKLYLVDLLLMK